MDEGNGWGLTPQSEAEFTLVVQAIIERIEGAGEDEPLFEKDLSGTGLNPYNLWKILEKLGYEKYDEDSNGWEIDFWIRMKKPGYKPLAIEACGMTFEMKLIEEEGSW